MVILTLWLKCFQSFKLEAAKGLAELCKDPAGLTKVGKKTQL